MIWFPIFIIFQILTYHHRKPCLDQFHFRLLTPILIMLYFQPSKMELASKISFEMVEHNAIGKEV